MSARAQAGGNVEKLVALLEAERERLQGELADAHTALLGLQEEQQRLTLQLATLGAENQRLAIDYVKMARQSSDLASLYVASLQLHASRKRHEVFTAIQEIVVGLIGCEEFAVFEVENTGRRLARVWQCGIDEGRLHSVPIGAGVIGRAAATGKSFVAGGAGDPSLSPEEAGLSACVPLRLGRRVTGAIALFRLLPHKAGLEESDWGLLDLLECHGAAALRCARRQAAARRPSQ
jgi:hypothetical protein